MAEIPQGLLAKLAPYLMGAGAGLLSNRGQLSGLGPGLLQGGELAQQQMLNRLRIQQEERAKIEQAQKDLLFERQQKIAQGFVGTPQENAAAAYPELAAKALFPDAASSSTTSAIMNMAEYERRMKSGDVDGARQLLNLALPPQVRDFGNYQGLVDRSNGQTTNVGTMGLPPQNQPANVQAAEVAKVVGAGQGASAVASVGVPELFAQADALFSENKATDSGAGALIDIAGNFVGADTEKAEAAAAFDTIAAQLTVKAPRLPGPVSDYEQKQYSLSMGALGDRTKPLRQRRASFNIVKQMFYAAQRRNQKNNPAAAEDAPPSAPNQPMPNQVIEWDEP